MNAGFISLAVFAVLAAAPGLAAAQTPGAPGPAALAVPHPLPPPVATLPVPPRDLFLHPDFSRKAPRPRSLRGGYAVPVFGYSAYSSGPAYAAPEVVPSDTARISRGGLRFESSPGSAQVYVDGLYAGVVEDFSLAPLELVEGTHHLELRAAGYAPAHFDVHIVAAETKRYKGDLVRLFASEPAAPAVTPPVKNVKKTTFVIPRCYAGDRPPTRPLPRGCDVANLVTR